MIPGETFELMKQSGGQDLIVTSNKSINHFFVDEEAAMYIGTHLKTTTTKA